MEFTPNPSSIFQNKKIKYNNKKPTKNGIIWINFSKIRKARCTLTPLSLRSARLTQYMRFARCTSLSHILLRFTTQNIAYSETLYAIWAPLRQKSAAGFIEQLRAHARLHKASPDLRGGFGLRKWVGRIGRQNKT